MKKKDQRKVTEDTGERPPRRSYHRGSQERSYPYYEVGGSGEGEWRSDVETGGDGRQGLGKRKRSVSPGSGRKKPTRGDAPRRSSPSHSHPVDDQGRSRTRRGLSAERPAGRRDAAASYPVSRDIGRQSERSSSAH